MTLAGIAVAACTFAGCSREGQPDAEPPASTQAMQDHNNVETSLATSSMPMSPASESSPPESGDTSANLNERADEVTQASTDGEVPAFKPLADAQEGEWVRLKAMDSRELRYKVVRAGAATVTTQVTMLQDGKPLGLPAMREDLRDWDPLAASARSTQATRAVARSTIDAAGRSWDALLYEDRWTAEGVPYVRRTWVHPNAPVLGTLRMELFGDTTLEASLELLAFGQRDEGERDGQAK